MYPPFVASNATIAVRSGALASSTGCGTLGFAHWDTRGLVASGAGADEARGVTIADGVTDVVDAVDAVDPCGGSCRQADDAKTSSALASAALTVPSS